MSLLSGVVEARRALSANRLRTMLTLLGMIIGVAAVVLVVALGQRRVRAYHLAEAR